MLINSDKEFLSLFGWGEFFESALAENVSSSLFPARIISEERNLYRVQFGINSATWASVSGKMQFKGATRADYPAVGDWVLMEMSTDRADRGVIHQILPRKTVIQRKQVGAGTDMQILAANVDYVFVTTSMNEEFNLRRLERYIAMASESGATPVILLTKSDIQAEKVTDIIAEVQKEFPDLQIHAISKNDFATTDFFSEYLQRGKSSIFVGSSGVGKSTLVNFLIGHDQAKTQDVREGDGKGRHTTTARSLYVSRYGGLIIDTPGMRELQLSDHEEGIKIQFADVEELITHCRFSDCLHKTEPGCAIKAALKDGSLSEARWNSYQKLESEVRQGMVKQGQAVVNADRKVWKKKNIDAWNKGKPKKGED